MTGLKDQQRSVESLRSKNSQPWVIRIPSRVPEALSEPDDRNRCPCALLGTCQQLSCQRGDNPPRRRSTRAYSTPDAMNKRRKSASSRLQASQSWVLLEGWRKPPRVQGNESRTRPPRNALKTARQAPAIPGRHSLRCLLLYCAFIVLLVRPLTTVVVLMCASWPAVLAQTPRPRLLKYAPRPRA